MFFLLFCWMIEGSVSVSLTDGSGFGSGRPKNICMQSKFLICTPRVSKLFLNLFFNFIYLSQLLVLLAYRLNFTSHFSISLYELPQKKKKFSAKLSKEVFSATFNLCFQNDIHVLHFLLIYLSRCFHTFFRIDYVQSINFQSLCLFMTLLLANAYALC